MENLFGTIQDAIAKQLDAAFAPIPVFFEEIGSVYEKHGTLLEEHLFDATLKGASINEPQLPGDFIFVDLKPAGMDTLGTHRTDMSVLASISLHKKAENNREYRQLGMKMDSLFRPVFRFDGRAITVHSAGFEIVDRVLVYSFTFRFIPSQAVPVDETLEAMGEIVTMVINEKE